MSLTSHLYTVELTANVQKPWMNHVNNGLKQMSLLELLFVMNIQIFDIYILLLATPKKLF